MTRCKLSSFAPLSTLVLSSWLSFSGTGCGRPLTPASTATPRADAPQSAASAAAIEVPLEPKLALLEHRIVARGLANPRGMQPLPPHTLLVAEAGTGVPDDALTGRLLRLDDKNEDGDFLDADERSVLLDKQPSRNILDVVRRDEVFGMAGMEAADGHVMVALAFFGGPSTLFQVDGDRVTKWGTTHENINDLTFDPNQKQWFAVASTSDEVVRLTPGGGAERVLKIPALENGQDPVPAYLRYDPLTRDLLVTLFSGSPEGEEGGLGVELMPRAGGIIAVEHGKPSSFASGGSRANRTHRHRDRIRRFDLRARFC